MTQTARKHPDQAHYGPGQRLLRLVPHALAGILAAAIFLGVADLVSRLFGPTSSALVALGSAVIRLSPSWLQEFAISAFGNNDKLVLYISMGVVGTVIAALIGVLARTRMKLALGAFLLVAAILLAAVLVRPENSAVDAVPTLLGAVLGLLALLLLSGAATGWLRPREAGSSAEDMETRSSRSRAEDSAHSRRRFIGLAAAGTAIAAGSIAFGRSVNAFGQDVGQAAARQLLPSPAVQAAAIPDAASIGVEGMPPFITPNDNFYRIDTALAVPELSPEDWSLRIHGMVEEEVTITMEELLELPLVEHHVTLTCVSNPVGGDLVGNATWLGYPIRELLARARPTSNADMVLSRSVDGWTASTPLEVLTDEERESLVAVGMNGEPLPAQHGYPARLVVPGLYGFVSATKWVTELELTRFDEQTAYWTDRGWNERGPVLVASRIDVPRPLAEVAGEQLVVAGTAWAQHVGVETVEVRLDDGDWEAAELAAKVTDDTWRQWKHTFADVDSGRHSVTVRAINAEGEVQSGERRDSIPGSATGHHRIEFSVS